MKALGLRRVLRAPAIATIVFGVPIAASQTRALEPIGNADGLGDLGARIIAAEGGPGRNPLSSAAGMTARGPAPRSGSPGWTTPGRTGSAGDSAVTVSRSNAAEMSVTTCDQPVRSG